MAITIKHGTPTAALAGSFAAGLGKRDVRNQSVYLKQANIEQARQDAKQKQFQDYSYRGYLEKMRQTSYAKRDADQRIFAGEQAEKQNAFRAGESALDREGRAGIAEGESIAASKAGDLEFAQGQYNSAQSSMDALRKSSGGQFSDPDFQAKYDAIQRGLPKVDVATGKQLNHLEALQEKTRRINELLNGYRPDMITPQKDRPGGSWTTDDGRMMERDEKENAVQKGWSPGSYKKYLDSLPKNKAGDALEWDAKTGKTNVIPIGGASAQDSAAAIAKEIATINSVVKIRIAQIPQGAESQPGNSAKEIWEKVTQELYPGGRPSQSGTEQQPTTQGLVPV